VEGNCHRAQSLSLSSLGWSSFGRLAERLRIHLLQLEKGSSARCMYLLLNGERSEDVSPPTCLLQKILPPSSQKCRPEKTTLSSHSLHASLGLRSIFSAEKCLFRQRDMRIEIRFILFFCSSSSPSNARAVPVVRVAWRQTGATKETHHLLCASQEIWRSF